MQDVAGISLFLDHAKVSSMVKNKLLMLSVDHEVMSSNPRKHNTYKRKTTGDSSMSDPALAAPSSSATTPITGTDVAPSTSDPSPAPPPPTATKRSKKK